MAHAPSILIAEAPLTGAKTATTRRVPGFQPPGSGGLAKPACSYYVPICRKRIFHERPGPTPRRKDQ
jgi:hypothetical protein